MLFSESIAPNYNVKERRSLADLAAREYCETNGKRRNRIQESSLLMKDDSVMNTPNKKPRTWLIGLLLLGMLPAVAAYAADDARSGSWSGVIINASCNADEAFAEAAKCTAETPGAPLALYDDTI